jgi:hypothetical protein
MRRTTKWLLVSIGGGLLTTVTLATLPGRWIDAPENSFHPIADKAMETVLWPIAVCVYLPARSTNWSYEAPCSGSSRPSMAADPRGFFTPASYFSYFGGAGSTQVAARVADHFSR